MKKYIIQFNTNPRKYLIMHNVDEVFFLKFDIEVTEEIGKATQFESIQKASFVNQRSTYKNVQGVIRALEVPR